MGGKDPGIPSPPDFEDGAPAPRPFDSSMVKRTEPPRSSSKSGFSRSGKRFEPKPLLQYQGRTIVRDEGRIAYLMLPSKFELRNQVEDDAIKKFEYMIPNADSMKISHWRWLSAESRFTEDVGAAFLKLLSAAPHKLDDAELELADQVIPLELYGYSNNYDLISVKTEKFGGMNVLLIETKWFDADRKACGFFYPADSSAQTLESLHFEGTELDYRKNFLATKAALIRIKWRF